MIGAGGTSLTIGGNLSNSSTSNGGVSVGNTGITSADTLTVNGTGGLSNTGTIDIEGGASVQATLNVANAAAGFGTAGTETGNVFLENDALLEFKSGQITTIDGTLQLDGANARVASGTKLTTNSALTGLTTVAGNFWLQNGAKVSPTGNVSITGNGTDRARRKQYRRRWRLQPHNRREPDQRQHQRERHFDRHCGHYLG